MTNNNMISPNPRVRTIGVVWLLYFAVAILGGVLTRGIVIRGDAVATASNILASATLYRAGISLDFAGNLIYIALVALLYGLFRPVDRRVALLATIFGVVGATVQIMAELLRLAPLVLLTDPQISGTFTAAQLQAAVMFSLRLYARSFEFSFVLFALFELAIAYLILKSKFLPRAIGLLWVLAGLSWPLFLWPPLAAAVQPIIIGIGGAAEISLSLWLVIKGVDAVRWRQWTEGLDQVHR